MRQLININQNWLFSKEATAIPASLPQDWEQVNLPHSWNNVDGQDGGNDYFRGTTYYAKTLNKAELPIAQQYYLEIKGANSSADVYLDGKHLCHHDGGYSTWRVNLTENLQQSSLLVVAVDNAPNDRVYPQMADFTFYGGLYRDVNLLAVSDSHFDLDCYGGPGIQVTPIIDGDNAKVAVQVYLTGSHDGQSIRYTLKDKEGNIVAQTTTADTYFAVIIAFTPVFVNIKIIFC